MSGLVCIVCFGVGFLANVLKRKGSDFSKIIKQDEHCKNANAHNCEVPEFEALIRRVCKI